MSGEQAGSEKGNPGVGPLPTAHFLGTFQVSLSSYLLKDKMTTIFKATPFPCLNQYHRFVFLSLHLLQFLLICYLHVF